MLYGRRLEEALDQVGESRYALVHALSRRSRQITRHLAAQHVDLEGPADSAPTIAGTEGDPLKIAEEEIIEGLVIVGEPQDDVIDVMVPEDALDPLLATADEDEVVEEDVVVAADEDEVIDDAVDAAPIVTGEEADEVPAGIAVISDEDE